MTFRKPWVRTAAITTLMSFALTVQADTLDAESADIQRQWDVIQYQASADTREQKFQALADRAAKLSETYPGKPEPLVWQGVALGSYARAKGGLGALGAAKQARDALQAAIAIDAAVMKGTALYSLGALYANVPGWPIGFGDKTLAETNFQKAFGLNPDGLDINYFYGSFLMEQKRYDEARSHFQRAIKAPTRPGRELADDTRREDTRKLMAKLPN